MQDGRAGRVTSTINEVPPARLRDDVLRVAKQDINRGARRYILDAERRTRFAAQRGARRRFAHCCRKVRPDTGPVDVEAVGDARRERRRPHRRLNGRVVVIVRFIIRQIILQRRRQDRKSPAELLENSQAIRARSERRGGRRVGRRTRIRCNGHVVRGRKCVEPRRAR
jgi:hypothetical protein